MTFVNNIKKFVIVSLSSSLKTESLNIAKMNFNVKVVVLAYCSLCEHFKDGQRFPPAVRCIINQSCKLLAKCQLENLSDMQMAVEE